MKKHVFKFGQFINEMAKGDYFRAGDDLGVYGLHKTGSSDWSDTAPEEAPDEELGTEEFMSKYGQEIEDPAFDRYRKTWAPETRVKVWKGMERDGRNLLTKKKEGFASMSDRELKNAYDGLRTNLKRIESGHGKSHDPEIIQAVKNLFGAVKKELMLRRGSK